MINDKELQIANTSYTKKDFYQIYPEILALVNKISERWDPSSSNESDPGVVLLKVLAFVADKNNYNIDKNVLECFMPSASQEDSMKKLCDMMGYNMKYYQSATTDISFMYQGSELTEEGNGTSFTLKAYDTVISNEDDDVEYILTQDVTIDKKYKTYTTGAIEGTLCQAYAGDSTTIRLNNLDDNHRFYLPEAMIAENGIFITSISDDISDTWDKVDNLNIIQSGSYVYKFGYDSHKGLPYIEFPEDIASLIGEGIQIKYIRTTGSNGNVSAASLTKLKGHNDVEVSLDDVDNTPVIVISNASASTNGADKETIDEAYNNFKRTVGTFDTLVTCRDYANKIYQLVNSSDNTTPLVSNIQVSDIRDDINKSIDIVSYNSYGIYNVNEALDDSTFNHFNLIIYPFKPITSSYTKVSYLNSFKPETDNVPEILADLEDYKTIAHNIILPSEDDIYCIKNYYDLKAKITTTYKVNETEQASILDNVHKALYKKFNMRNVDFGEKLPFDTILTTLQNADTRIKNVSLEEPDITTKYSLQTSQGWEEYDLSYNNYTKYIDFLAHNILAGRTELFNYDNRLNFKYGQSVLSGYEDIIYGGINSTKKIVSIDTSFELDTANNLPYILKDNETLQFSAPSFKTTITYPAYVNYYFIYAHGSSSSAVAAQFTQVSNDSLAGWNLKDSQGNTITEINASTIGIINAAHPLYIKYTQDISKKAGFLIDSSGIVYRAVTRFSSGTLYYTPTPSNPYSLGSDASPASISAGTEYRLQQGDILYINYTNNDDIVTTIKYTYNKISTTTGDSGVWTDEDAPEEGNIIKPTGFSLINSSEVGKTPTKYVVVDGGTSYGFYSLSSSQQIEIREYVRTKLISSTKCYWLIGTGTINFNTNGEYTLKDGEYFFYTNDAETELVTLGSGTKLISAYPIDEYTISYDDTNALSADDIASKGLAAFKDVNWKILTFTTTKNLILQEMQYITLTSGDTLNSISSVTEITSSPTDVQTASYIINGTPSVLPTMAINGIYWQVISRLDLNVGPSLTQTLTNTNDKIDLYTTGSTEPIKTLIGNSNEPVSFQTNYLMQRAGGKGISTVISEYNGLTTTEIDDFTVSVFKSSNVTSGTSVISSIPTSNKEYMQVYFTDSESTNIPIIIPTNEFGICMIYYNKISNITTDLPYVLSSVDASIEKINDTSATNQITLDNGINIIKILKSTTLTLKRNSDVVSNATISGISIVYNTHSGVNTDVLFPSSVFDSTSLDTYSSALLNRIKTLDKNSIFYYNCPITNSSLIETTNMLDSSVWYDYNNIYNKFVISELNVIPYSGSSAFPNIVITKGSKL